jgi:hypothetical protein
MSRERESDDGLTISFSRTASATAASMPSTVPNHATTCSVVQSAGPAAADMGAYPALV